MKGFFFGVCWVAVFFASFLEWEKKRITRSIRIAGRFGFVDDATAQLATHGLPSHTGCHIKIRSVACATAAFRNFLDGPGLLRIDDAVALAVFFFVPAPLSVDAACCPV
jgi:hypothetical protein